ncbi:MAG: OmpH family outer membrane protein [Lysobacterales bacterium]
MTQRFKPLQLLLASLLLAAMLTPSGALAQGKIGYVDFEYLMENSPQVRVRKAGIQERFAQRYQELDADERELEDLEDRLVRDTAVMSEERRQALERQVRNMRRDLLRDKEDLADELQIAHDEELKKVTEEIYAIVERYARDQQYDLILASPALYYSESIDLTSRLLEQLEKASN